jgi:hypothetical protein
VVKDVVVLEFILRIPPLTYIPNDASITSGTTLTIFEFLHEF